MDAQSSSSDDVKGLERRLSEWRPAAAGLDADGVLFAAGRASVRPGWGRIAWPVLSGFLALLAAILGAEPVAGTGRAVGTDCSAPPPEVSGSPCTLLSNGCG